MKYGTRLKSSSLVILAALLITPSCRCWQDDASDWREEAERAEQRRENRARFFSAYPDWARRGREWQTPAPSPARRDGLFRAASREQVDDPLGPGLLLCRFDLVPNQGHDSYGAPDVYARLEIAENGIVRRAGGYRASSRVLSWPAVTLTSGQMLDFQLFDGDIGRDDLIGRLAVTFDGRAPFAAEHDAFSVECRFLPESSLGVQAEAAADAVDEAMASLLSSNDRASDQLRADVRDALTELAGLLGWGIPRFATI